jgi:hypothetical protein
LDGADPAGTGILPANGATVSTWADKSGNARNSPANTTGAVFAANSLNGRGTINFTAQGRYYVTPNFVPSSTNAPSIFVVAQQTGYTSGNSEIVIATVGSPTWATFDLFGSAGTFIARLNMYNNQGENGGISISSPAFISIVGSGAPSYSASMFGNGTLNVTFTGSGTNPLSTSMGFNIGSSAGFIGNIYDVIMYNTALSTLQRQQIEGYLAWKWGLQANLPADHPYKSAAPTSTSTAPARPIISLPRATLGGSFQFTTSPSQYLSIPNSTAFTQNTAFTYEFWYYPTSTNAGYLVAMLQPNWITVKWNIGSPGSIGLDMSYVGNPPGYVKQDRIYAINRWHHIALTWNGTNGVLYVNGVSEAVFTGAGGLVNAGNDLRIGQYQGQGQPTPLGYFTNFRWVKGVSVYTGAFTPPTRPLTVTQSAGTNISAITAGQTQLLISATTSGSLLTDSSTNNFTITNNGSVAWNILTPFS